MTKFKVHFPEQTIEIDGELFNNCTDKESAEFYACSMVEADSVEVDL